MEELRQVLIDYGYLVLFIGTFLEGETILLVAGYLASTTDYLSLRNVIFFAFLGTFFGDQLYFYIGYRYGHLLLKRSNAVWLARAERVKALLNRYDTWFILSFRFFYGLRNVTPFVLGMSKINPLRYFLLNATAAFIWAMSFGWSGYLFGSAVNQFLEELKSYEYTIFGVLFVIGMILWIYRRIRAGKESITQTNTTTS